MKKLLVSDMNDMRHQQEDLKRAAGQSVVDVEDDPIRLKIALKVNLCEFKIFLQNCK